MGKLSANEFIKIIPYNQWIYFGQIKTFHLHYWCYFTALFNEIEYNYFIDNSLFDILIDDEDLRFMKIARLKK